MMNRRQTWLGLVVSIATAAHAGAAQAQAQNSLSVQLMEGLSWSAAVSAMQSDVGSNGRAVHVVVQDAAGGGRPLPCGSYRLAIEPAAAFAIGACDPGSNATEVRLLDRRGLFSAAGPVPQALSTVTLSASYLASGGTAGGGATAVTSTTRCMVLENPSIVDLMNSTPDHQVTVPLTPPRFRLEPFDPSVSVAWVPGQGWSISKAGGGGSIRYRVVDVSNGQPVIPSRDSSPISCNAGPTEVAAPAQPPPSQPSTTATVAVSIGPAASGGGPDSQCSRFRPDSVRWRHCMRREERRDERNQPR